MTPERRRRDDEGVRRMREVLLQGADPHDRVLLDEPEIPETGNGVDPGLTAARPLPAADDEAIEVVDTMTERAATDAADSTTGENVPVNDETALATGYVDEFPRPYPGAPTMTTVSADTRWNGVLQSDGNLYVEGQVKGTLDVRDTIYIAEQAMVDGKVKALNIVVSGHLNGRIECLGRLEVTPTGRLTGHIESGFLVVHEGAVLEVKFKQWNSRGNRPPVDNHGRPLPSSQLQTSKKRGWFS